MNLLYTVCSANHLAHAKTMLDGFLAQHPGWVTRLVLVDEIQERFDPAFFAPHQVIPVQSLSLPRFDQMAQQYSVLELNCAIKVLAGRFFLAEEQLEHLFYLDSDTQVWHPLTQALEALQQHDWVITPHFTHPYPPDEYLPNERVTLRSGLYNAGFLAVKPTPNARAIFDWWAGHMYNECYYDFAEGMGVDQNWLNLLPILFQGVYIWNHPGANLAYWNLHERTLSFEQNAYRVNGQYPLLFLHISGYSFDAAQSISRHQNRYQWADQPVWGQLMDQYRKMVTENGYDRFHGLSCAYARPPKKSRGIMRFLNRCLAPWGWKLTNA